MYYSLSFRDCMPWCVYFGQYRQSNHWEHNGTKRPFHLLVFVTGGKAVFRFSGKTFEVGEGDWVLVPGGTFYSADTDDWCEYYYFHFNASLIPCGEVCPEPKSSWGSVRSEEESEALPALDPSNGCVLSDYMHFPAQSPEFLPLCAQLHQKLFKKQSEAEYEYQLTFCQMLLELSKQLRCSAEPESSSLINTIVNYIHEHITEPITLNSLSERFRYSKTFLLKLFRQTLHTTVTEYINNEKLDCAVQLLRTSIMNINEISDYLGFSDPAYFSRLFKKRFGICPSKYN